MDKKAFKKNETNFKKIISSGEKGKLTLIKDYVVNTIKYWTNMKKGSDDEQYRMIEATTKEINGFVIHKLPLLVTYNDPENQIRKCLIGSENERGIHKTILLVGATGSGKSTMVDGIVNYIYGIELEDKYRLKLIDLEDGEEKSNQSMSQTEWITAYKITPSKHTQINFSLTIVDMPGFGDTRGMERDKTLMKNIKHLFSTEGEGGLDSIDAVCFLAKSTDARLTPVQKYIFDSVLAIFGDDIRDHIQVFASFADGGEPAVLGAMKAAAVPFKHCFKFNNAALFPNEDDPILPIYWKMGLTGYHDFFEHLKKVEAKSLQLTKQVLQEREKLNAMVHTLQDNIQKTMKKIEDQSNLERQIKENMNDLVENENFEITLRQTRQEKVNCKEGEYVTYCTECEYTCHEECPVKEDDDLKNCCVMENEHCIVCPKKCLWSDHVSNDFYYRKTVIKVKSTIEEMKEKYSKAAEKIEEAEMLLKPLEEEKMEMQNHVQSMVTKVAECMKRLDDIALKKGPPSEEDYIDLLIENEKQDCNEGYQDRIVTLQELKNKAITVKKISENKNMFSKTLDVPRKQVQEPAACDYVSCEDEEDSEDNELVEPIIGNIILFKHDQSMFIGKVKGQHKVYTTSKSIEEAKIDFAKRKIPKSLIEWSGKTVELPEWNGLLAVFPKECVSVSPQGIQLKDKNVFLKIVGSHM